MIKREDNLHRSNAINYLVSDAGMVRGEALLLVDSIMNAVAAEQKQSSDDKAMIPREVVLAELLREYKYWRDVNDDDEKLVSISIGAMGSVANVLAKVMLGKEQSTDAPETEAKD